MKKLANKYYLENCEFIHLNLTIQAMPNGEIFDININDGLNSISYDNHLPTLEELLKEFDY